MGRRSWSFAGRGHGGGSPARIQARAGGRWTKNPSLGCEICPNPDCRSIIAPLPPTYPQRFPDACVACGTFLTFGTCSAGECEDRFPDPDKFLRGEYRPCGEPAVALTIYRRRPRCAEHAEEPALLQEEEGS